MAAFTATNRRPEIILGLRFCIQAKILSGVGSRDWITEARFDFLLNHFKVVEAPVVGAKISSIGA